MYGTEAGASIAIEALLDNQAQESWTDGDYLDVHQHVQVMDGNFLFEGQDSDSTRRWNFWEKYQYENLSSSKPIDDLLVTGTNSASPYLTDTTPDLQVRVPNQFTIDIDVDKVRSKHIAGSGAEFGTGAEGLFGTKLTYNFDCIGTLPGRDRTSAASPKAEVLVGYRYVPSGM
jgi:hypothetical protein